MTRKLYTSILLFALTSITARATHMSGGEIYWDCLGNNQYRITLVVYRDCAGINVDPSYDLDITSPCANHTLNVSTPGGTELSQLCDLELPNSTCNGGSLPGIQQYIYTGVITLPPCDFWTISWTNIWRNNAIVNLQNPGSQPMYIEATLNNTINACDDSPTFTNLAIPYVCLGYPITYSYGTVDPEGDSLSYSLITARTAGNAPIPYVAPFSPGQPITGLTLDPVTGQLNFTCSLSGNWVVVVQVSEWDANGNLIGTIMRDMQFVVYPCSNVPPDPTTGTVTNLSGNAVQTAPYAVQVCESGNFCFDMVISDPNANNVLEATSNVAASLQGATFSYSGTNPITCHVCWTASAGSAGFYPFIVNVSDGACPIVAFQTYVYSIHVIPGLMVALTSTDESCAGNGDGTAGVSIVTGTGPYQYTWGTIGATSSSITAGAGIYPVSVTDANGCVSAPTAAVINTSQPPTANAGPDLVACFGAWPIALQGTSANATSSAWSGGSGTYGGSFPNSIYTPSASEIAAGAADLILTATNASACPPAVDAVYISISNGFVNASISSTNASCNGGTDGSASFLPSSPSFSYLWTPTGQTTATATGLGAGGYSVQVTDQLNCTTNLNTTVGAPTAITISNIQATSETCAGQGNGSVSVTASGGTPPYLYSWNNGATTPTITVGAGTYTVQVTDANGCTPATASATVSAAAQPNVAQAGPDVIGCMNSLPVQLQGSVINASSGTWSGGAGSFTGFGLGVHYNPTNAEIANGGVDLQLTTTGNNGCPADVDSVHVTLSNSFLNAGISATTVACAGGSTGSASFVPNSATLTYLWSDPAHQNTATATGLAGGNYTVVVTDQLGCDTTMSVSVPEPSPLAVTNVTAVDPTCASNSNGIATASVSGGTPGYSYLWSANTGGQTTSVANNLGSGTYIVVVTDANGCTAQGNATITAPQPITLTAQVPDTVCVNAPVQLNAQASGGTGNLTINWVGIGSGSPLTYSFPASQLVTVSVSDAAGCNGPTLTFPVIVLDMSNAALSTWGDTTTCLGAVASVGAQVIGYSGSVTYTWPELSTTGAGPHMVPVSSTQTLHVVATNICGQTLNGTVQLVLEVPPFITLPPIIGQGCAPLTVEFPDSLTAQNVTWLWNLGDGTTSTAPAPVHTYGAGNYTVSLTVTTPAGCSAAALNTGSVIVHPSPTAAFTASTYSTDMAAPTVEFTNNSTGSINNYAWTFGDGATSANDSPSHTYGDIGQFDVQLTVTDVNGCTGSATSIIEILPIYDVVIPNAFTPDPNGGGGGAYDPTDLSNNVFYPFVRFVKEFKMRIWNRWGELVFETEDVKQGWDGHYRGQLSPQDVYVYRCWIRFVDDREADRTGDLTLFR